MRVGGSGGDGGGPAVAPPSTRPPARGCPPAVTPLRTGRSSPSCAQFGKAYPVHGLARGVRPLTIDVL